MHDTHEVSLSARSFRASLVSIRAASRGALRAIHAVEQLYLSHNAHASTKSVKREKETWQPKEAQRAGCQLSRWEISAPRSSKQSESAARIGWWGSKAAHRRMSALLLP